MTDGESKGAGISYMMRCPLNLLAQYPTWEAAAQAMQAGTFPLDLIFNSAGWQQIGDFINKFTLLKDSTAALYGKDATAVPDDILVDIFERFLTVGLEKGDCYLETGSFYTPGSFNDQCTLSTANKPFFLFLSNGGDARARPLVLCLRDCSIAQISINSSFATDLLFTQNAATWTDNSVQFKLNSPYDAIWQYFILSKAV